MGFACVGLVALAIVTLVKQPRRCSLAETREQLPAIVRSVERGGRVEITRRGEPVAVLLSLEDYQRLTQPRVDLVSALKKFRAEADLDALRADEVFDGTRDRSPGRNVAW